MRQLVRSRPRELRCWQIGSFSMAKNAQPEKLFDRAVGAYTCFVGHLLEHTLTSAWGEQGCGWQQMWTSHQAGVYASCSGIILLDHLPSGDRQRTQAEQLAERVFHEHLCPIMDDSHQAKCLGFC